jgi:CrcB protein
MMAYFLVAIGGALGSVGRYWLSGLVAERVGETFPWGTILVNISGSFVIGVFAALTATEGRWAADKRVVLFFMYGICGGYTTFSSFSLQTLRLVQDREWLYAGGNVVVSVALCLLGVWLGYVVGSVFNTLKGG